MNQREEAIRRLEILESKGMIEVAKQLFTQKNTIPVFERTVIAKDYVFGTIFSLEEVNEFPEYQEYDLRKKISEFEEKYNSVVYLATTEKTEFGLLLDLFYVSQYEEEWSMDYDAFRNDMQCVYVINLTDSFCSEFGSIGFEVKTGGVLRTA